MASSAQDVDGAMHLVDLDMLDARALFENAEVAKQELGVSDAHLQRVEVLPTPDGRGQGEHPRPQRPRPQRLPRDDPAGLAGPGRPAQGVSNPT